MISWLGFLLSNNPSNRDFSPDSCEYFAFTILRTKMSMRLTTRHGPRKTYKLLGTWLTSRMLQPSKLTPDLVSHLSRCCYCLYLLLSCSSSLSYIRLRQHEHDGTETPYGPSSPCKKGTSVSRLRSYRAALFGPGQLAKYLTDSKRYQAPSAQSTVTEQSRLFISLNS